MPAEIKLRRWGKVYGLYPYPIAAQTLAFSLAFDPNDSPDPVRTLMIWLVHEYCPADIREEDGWNEESVIQLARDIMIEIHRSPSYKTGMEAYDLKRGQDKTFGEATVDKGSLLGEVDEAESFRTERQSQFLPPEENEADSPQDAAAKQKRRERLEQQDRILGAQESEGEEPC